MSDAPQRVYTGSAASRALSHAVEDVAAGVAAIHVWGLLGWHDIRRRYRRSVLGPFWLTISTAVMVTAMGFLYSKILNQDLSSYLPFLAIGLVVWQMLAAMINDSCDVFGLAEHMIKQIRLPLTTHVCRILWRNVIIFAHNAVIIVGVALFYSKLSIIGMLMAFVGFACVILNCLWASLVLGVLCARFRDIPPTMANFVQVAFFLTPILWHPELLGERIALAYGNPFYHLIEAIRGPIMGTDTYINSLAVVFLMLLVGFPLTLLFFSRYRARVPYWL